MPEAEARLATLSTALEPGALRLSSLNGTEQLGRPFAYELELIGTTDEISLADVLGTSVTITIPLEGGGERHLNGIVTHFQRAAAREPAGRVGVYQATVHPTLWLLTRSSDCRIFQNLSAVEIIKQVFNDHGLTDVEDALTGSYSSLEFVVQYRETAFNFVSRLMEQEGIYYYFRHTDGGHTLVLTDAATAHGTVPGYEQVPYLPSTSSMEGVDHLRSWSVSHRLLPDRYVLNDYDYARPNADLLVEMSAQPQTDTSYEMYDYPGEYLQTADGEAFATVRLEELHSRRQLYEAEGNTRGLGSGTLFSVTGAPHEADGEYLVTRATYDIEIGEHGFGEASGGGGFRVNISALPSSVPFRPSRSTPKPIVSGPQTATVVGPSGEEIFTDAQGRIKVLFHWDRRGRQQGNENTSCWLRVAQVWAGTGFGALHVPRVGDEVIVEFLEGDPDRPIVTGRVYNGSHSPPFDLPASRTQSGIRSRSSAGGGSDNCNELRFEDKAGEEHVYLQAEKDMVLVVKNDEVASVGNNRSRSVAAEEDVSIGGGQTLSVGASQSVTVGADQSTSIGGSEQVSVGGVGTRTVAAADSVTVGGAYTLSAGGGISMSATVLGVVLGGSESHSMGGGRSATISKGDELSVGKGRKTKIGDDDEVDVGKKLVLKAGKEIQLVAGKAKLTLKSDGKILLEGKELVVKTSGKATVKAGGDLTLKGSKVKGN